MVYALLYMLFTIYPIIFQQKRHWNSGVGELPLIGTVVGAVIGGAYVFYDSAQNKKKVLAGHPRRPEDRLNLAIIGGILFPVTMVGALVTLRISREDADLCSSGSLGLENTTLSTGLCHALLVYSCRLPFSSSSSHTSITLQTRE